MAAKIGKTVKDSQPWWPEMPARPPGLGKEGAPNILVILFDDVGFSDLGCYGSPIRTPAIDAIAGRGLRYTGFHTTAMCSTTRAALLTGRNHHSVGVGCLANFDSGYPGYRGKIAREAGTLAEMLRPHGYRNYMLGKWHVTPLTESGATGPFDGWPLGRGFDRYYGFMDAETDQYAPELVRDNTPCDPPGTFADGYHLTSDLVDQAIRYLADHVADNAATPWLTWLAFGACHAPHQAPFKLIHDYDAVFSDGWDVERERRLARQIELGIVPAGTALPPRNDLVRAWAEVSPDEQRLFTRLQAAYAAMLDHADQHIARLMAFLEASGQLDDTLVVVMSDNGASQEGGPFGMVNAMGPYNLKREPLEEKIGRIDHLVVAGVGGKIFEPGREPGAMARAMEADSPDDITDPMLRSFRLFADEQKEDRLALAACSNGPREAITKDALRAIRRPTLVIAGSRDQLAGPPQGLADAIAGARAVTLPGCDHFSMIAHGLFKASVFDFFDGWLE